MFTDEQRTTAREFVLTVASNDSRITSGAVVGSFARRAEDRWSDIDLTFGVSDLVAVNEVIADWSERLATDLDAVPVWEGHRTYKVFVLPGTLQLDLSFSRASEFRPAGPAFDLVFGHAGPPDEPAPPAIDHHVGWGLIQAIHAWRCIERTRYWQTEQAIGAVRDSALAVACLQRGLDPSYGRGYDDLPGTILADADATHVGSLEPEDFRTALGASIQFLLTQAVTVAELPEWMVAELSALSAPMQPSRHLT